MFGIRKPQEYLSNMLYSGQWKTTFIYFFSLRTEKKFEMHINEKKSLIQNRMFAKQLFSSNQQFLIEKN
jgi:hypothetical protein